MHPSWRKRLNTTRDLNALLGHFTVNPWARRLVSLGTLAAAAALAWVAPSLAPLLFAIPVALAAVLDGWVGGLAAAAASTAACTLAPASSPLPAGILLFLLAAVIAAAAAHERHTRLHFQKAARQLSSVYEKVQANFEGMKRAERLSAIGQLSAGLAHEIRNPLASISGAAAILARSHNFDARNTKCLEIITSECDRLNGLLTNFLNFARPRPPRLQIVPLEPLLDNVLELASHGVRGKTVLFDKRIEPGLQAAECDPEQLEQVLLNLMINAVEASPDGGTVTLSAASDDNGIAIGVVDRGHGVAPAHIDHLFDPFFTTKEHGTGLGLPVAHQIVRQMGGSLQAQVNGDRGMTFSIVLPTQAHHS